MLRTICLRKPLPLTVSKSSGLQGGSRGSAGSSSSVMEKISRVVSATSVPVFWREAKSWTPARCGRARRMLFVSSGPQAQTYGAFHGGTNPCSCQNRYP